MELNFPKIERKILKFWKQNKIFEKLRKKNQGKPRWSFLDGPITANNPMGVHHAWGRTYKDLFQRFKAMQGFEQRFQNGFDCQGLWVEVEVEKELGFKTKKDIEKYGIAKFVEKCKERVKKYSKIQTQQSIRLGQWMDWPNSYYTMSDENNYAIWHFLKKCREKGLIYKGRDAVPWCPRCGTAISQHEILTEDYQEITHDSIYLKYPIVGRRNEFLLVWTTTPWTLPGNVAIAVDPKKEYAIATGTAAGNKHYILKALAPSLGLKVVDVLKGEKLVGLKYESPFDDFPRIKKSLGDYTHEVIAADPLILAVSDTEGTGLVHIAPAAGAEDFRLAKKIGLPVIELIDEEANYIDGLGEFSGKNAKDDPAIIIDYLKKKDAGKYFFDIKPVIHRYPVCWRCKSELVWRVVDEWYIAMAKPLKSKISPAQILRRQNLGGQANQKSKIDKNLRKKLMDVARKINWIPSFGLERELDWLKNMQDWLISKKRYWGLALPIFECPCGNFEVIGSKEELKKRAVSGWKEFKNHSPHRPWVDKVKIKCSKCKKIISRIPDVGNPWLDAGIVPFSTVGYFQSREYWQKWFPADLICESFPGQFKNWFYSLIVMSAVLENTNPAKTIFGYALVRDEKGEEMHKSKGNAIWFDEAVEKIGADPMRWMYGRHNPAENLNFGWRAAEEIKRKLLTLYNSLEFFNLYASVEDRLQKTALPKTGNILDKWIISRLNSIIEKVTKNLEKYDAASAVLMIENFFVDDLSLWYIRRSRRRFQRPKTEKEKQEAVNTLHWTILNLIKLIAPAMPFWAESVYQPLRLKRMPESIHLCDWPKAQKNRTDPGLEEKMGLVRDIAAFALAKRAEAGIKVRQPLQKLKIKNEKLKINDELKNLIKEELNVKEVIFDSKIREEIELDTTITQELKEEGIMREVVRHIQDMRKECGYKPRHKIMIQYNVSSGFEKMWHRHENYLKRETQAQKIIERPTIHQQKLEVFDREKEIQIDGEKIWLAIKKI